MADISRDCREPLEAQCKSVPTWIVLDSAWQVDGTAVQPLQGFWLGPIVLPKQPLGNM
jgi:hypothetical protein